jgi:hypothetical protein
MTDTVWRKSFDSCAAQYRNEASTAGSARDVEFLAKAVRREPAP